MSVLCLLSKRPEEAQTGEQGAAEYSFSDAPVRVSFCSFEHLCFHHS